VTEEPRCGPWRLRPPGAELGDALVADREQVGDPEPKKYAAMVEDARERRGWYRWTVWTFRNPAGPPAYEGEVPSVAEACAACDAALRTLGYRDVCVDPASPEAIAALLDAVEALR